MAEKESTVQLEVTLTLPQSVAQEAAANGILRPASLESLVREAVRKRRIDHLFEVADRLAALPGPPLTEAELEEEIRAVRSRRRASHAGGR
jgi:hypothetical protein